MPIALLPDSTIRAIGSSLVLKDACSAVKELVGNALDAKATSVVVEISPNALEVIQVKDNGHGIGVDDRQLVCKHRCTSKIRTIEDLEKLGGSSLGFRGEALASVIELSDAVTVTTKVDGEIVGTTLKFSRDGALQSSASASHPVGSTIRIQGFLRPLPVRREVAKKGASRTMASIKKLLCNYAYARPSVRFSLRVLQANNERANWDYGPAIGTASIQDATAKIAGQEVAAQCELRSADFQQAVSQSAMRSFFSIDAVVVKTDAEPSKVHNIGHYISIDGRPVSPARGVMKDIVKRYKSFYRANCDHSQSRASNTDPFLCMHIHCPPGSYDVNIEPAKDDVLFLEPSKVMALVEKFFADYYGDPGSVTLNRNQAPAKHKATIAYDHSFDLLLAGKSTGKVEISTAPQSTSPPTLPVDEEARTEGLKVEPVNASVGNRRSPGSTPTSPNLSHSNQSLHDPTPVECRTGLDRPELHFTMYGTGDEDLLIIGSPPTTHEPTSEKVDEHEGGSASVTNPWSLAKLNAPTRPSIEHSNFQVERSNTIQLMTPDKAPDDPAQHPERPAWARKSIYPQSSIPSPAASSPSPGPHQNTRPPLRRRVHNGQQGKDDNTIVFTQYPNNEAPHPHPTDTIDAWLQARRPAMRQPSFRKTPVPYNEDDKLSIVARPGCGRQERNLDDSLSTQLTEPEDLVTEPAGNSNKTCKPFRSPFMGPNVASSGPVPNSDGLDFSHVGALPAPPPLKACAPVLDQLSSSQKYSSLLDYGNKSTSMPLPLSLSKRPFTMPQSLKTELTDILAFEQRKKAAVLHQRKLLSNGVLGELSPEKLAGIQRKSKSRSLLQRVPSQMRHDLPGLELREKRSNPVLRFGPGVGLVSGAEVGGLLRYNGPHQNHYPVVKERLVYAHLENNRKESRGYPGQEECKTGKLLDETQVRLSEDDPRAYLARISASEQRMDDLSGLTRTGLKIRRTKTALLPLETIPADANNHCLKAISPQRFPSTSSLIATSERQGRCDEYVLSGKNKFVRWSASSRDVIAWETTLKGHITKNFKARLAGGEVVAPEVVVMLTTAIKAHVDAHGP